ncbi:hypothetical protein AA313_de0206483 [Arthrobotrys entomopaga]|nr:hypothetical protein AA313_de0206483 [Arthrobotrys entomopaga]
MQIQPTLRASSSSAVLRFPFRRSLFSRNFISPRPINPSAKIFAPSRIPRRYRAHLSAAMFICRSDLAVAKIMRTLGPNAGVGSIPRKSITLSLESERSLRR